MLSVDLSLLSLFTQASPLVKAVMLLLLLASCLSWTLIFQQKRLFSKYQKACHAFEDQFWGGRDLGRLYQKLAEPSLYPQSKQGSQALFVGMYRSYLRLHQQLGFAPAVVLEGVERHASVLHQREAQKLGSQLPWLATIGSVTPYIGLFGTVWGIMNAFRALGQVQQASLSMVAPGISEALIATAMGLFAAIPAVIAYNRLSQARDKLQMELSLFAEELLGILHKQVHAEEGSLEQKTTLNTSSDTKQSHSPLNPGLFQDDDLAPI